MKIKLRAVIFIILITTLQACSTKINMTSTPENARVIFKGRQEYTPFKVSYSNIFGKKVPFLIQKDGYIEGEGFFPAKGGSIHVNLEESVYKDSKRGHDKYIYVESHYPFNNSFVNNEDDIVFSPEYSKNKRLKKVAIKPPDSCVNQQTSSNDIHVNTSTVILKNNCSVEMNLIEKELIKNGFSVFSWEMLHSTNQGGNISYLDAIKKRGVEVLFIVNSIESIQVGNNDLLLQRNYYEADNELNIGKSIKLSQKTIDCLSTALYEEEKKLDNYSLGASINITAVEVKSGKTFWNYQKSTYDLDNLINAFVKVDKKSSYCSLYKKSIDNGLDDRNQSLHFNNIKPSKLDNTERVKKIMAIRKSIAHFVRSFISG